MCFSATASFASGAAVAAVGVATLARSRHREEWLFASVPLLFAWHQFNEGMVWLGLQGQPPFGSLDGWGFAYMRYAQALLPALMSLAVYLLEPGARRKQIMLPFVALGAGLSVYILWALFAWPTEIYVRGHSVVYHNPGTANGVIATLYVIATCGALLASGYRSIMVLGLLNVAGLLFVLGWKAYAFTSVWCAYAAVISVLIYWHFHRRRQAEAAGQELRH